MIVALVSLVVVMALAVFGMGIFAAWRCEHFADKIAEANQVQREMLREERESLLKHHVEAVTAMTSYGRYELDAGERALKMQQIIDQRVKERTLAVKVDQAGNVLVDRAQHVEPGEQPPDPNVRSSSIVDEVHEYERDLARFTNDNYDYEKRDTAYQEQPLMEA